MGSKSTNTTQTNKPSQEQLDAYKYVTNVATNAASQPLQQYTGARVAGFTPDQQAAFEQVQNAQGVETPYINTAAQYAATGAAPITNVPSVGTSGVSTSQVNASQVGNAPGINAANVNYNSYTPDQFSSEGIAQFYNPYQQNVIDSTLANVAVQNRNEQNDLLGKAISSGASPFGGDRAGIAAAELARNQGLARNQTVADLENQGYNTALGAYQNQQNLNTQTGLTNAAQGLTAQQANQQAGLTAQTQNASNWLTSNLANQQAGLTASQANAANTLAGSQSNAANTLTASQANAGNYLNTAQNNAARAGSAAEQFAGLGTQAQNQALTGASALLQTGNLQQQLGQQQLDVPYQNFQEQQQYPRDVANWLINAINGNPTNLGSTSTTSQPSGNTLTSILGGITALGGLFAKRGGGIRGYDEGGAVDDRFTWAPSTGYGIDIPMLRQSAFQVSPTTEGINWNGGSNMTPTTSIPSYINALPQISQSAMPAPQTYALPADLLAAIRNVPKSLQPNATSTNDKSVGVHGSSSKSAGGGINGYLSGGNISEEYDQTPLGDLTPVVAAGLDPQTPAMPRQNRQQEASPSSDGIMSYLSPSAASDLKAANARARAPEGATPAMPAAPSGGGIIPQGMLDRITGPDYLTSPRSALVDSGLAMMASDSPNVLTGIGQGLQAGVGAWEKRKAESQARTAELDAHPVVDDSGPTIRVYYPSEKKWTDTGIPSTKAQELGLRQQEFDLQKQIAERGWRPATPEERAMYGVDPKLPLMIDPTGKPATLGAPSTVIDMKSEGKFAETYGGKQAEVASEIDPAAAKAVNEIQKSSLLGKLLDQVQTGPLAPTVANVGAWMQSVGVDPSVIGIDPKTPATLQAIGGLTNQMIMGKIGPGGFPANNFSEQDRKFILTTIPQMSDLPDAIRIKLAVSDRLNQLAVEKANAWDTAQDEAAKGGIPIDEAYRNFERDWRGHMGSLSLFGDLAKQAEGTGQATPAQGQAPGAAAPSPSPTGDQPPIDALKEGVITTFGNGQKWTLQGGKPMKVQ